MLYVKNGFKNDMFFVCVNIPSEEGYQIVRVFYDISMAEDYVIENQRIGYQQEFDLEV